jgi:hypothetical protein
MFNSAVRTTLTACRGYECQEKDGIFMLVFPDTSEPLNAADHLAAVLTCRNARPDIGCEPPQLRTVTTALKHRDPRLAQLSRPASP